MTEKEVSPDFLSRLRTQVMGVLFGSLSRNKRASSASLYRAELETPYKARTFGSVTLAK